MLDDLRRAVRSLRRQPGFSAVAILTLAFGIGVNTTVFSLVSGLFLQPLHVQDPDRLVVVMQRGTIINVPYGYSFPDYLDIRRAVGSLTDMAAFMPTPVHLSIRGQSPERTWVEVVSPNYFDLAQVSPAFGELLTPGRDEGRGGAPTAVLAYRYWQRRFGGDPAIVGQPITLNGQSFTVVGIAPESFTGLSWALAVSAWVPTGAMGALMPNGDAARDSRGAPMFRLMGRLAPGKHLSDARAEIEVVVDRLVAAYPDEHKGTRALVIPENRARPDPSVAEFLPVIAAVFVAMVGLILVIACANVANLMIARGLARQRDLVIRSALGASRFHLIRLHAMEGLVLASVAAVIALVLAHWAGRALSTFAPTGDMPVNVESGAPDWRYYAFTFVVAMAAGLLTAWWPALQASRFNLVESLKEGSAAAGTRRQRLRNLLVIGQVAMSLVVLTGGGLFVHSLRQMQTLGFGFQPAGLLLVSMDLGLQQYSETRGRQFVDSLIERASVMPGVTGVTAAVHVPLDYGIQMHDVRIDGPIPGTEDDTLPVAYNVVAPKFLETVGGRLLRGRALTAADDEAGRRVALVNQTMAAKLWPGQEPLGQRFRIGSDERWTEVVGLVADGKYLMLGEEPRPYFYVPLAQRYQSPITLMVRSAGDPESLVAPLRSALHDLDPDLPLFNVRTMEDHVRNSVFGLMPLRMGAALAAGQGLIGLLLAVMGLYAVVSYTVTRRTREIGVRVALGADSGDVVRLVVRDGLRLTIAGVVIGLVLAVGLGLVLSGALYGVRAMDLTVFAGVTSLLLAVSALACYLPARRATRVDPLVALRAE
jgi:predicted permease